MAPLQVGDPAPDFTLPDQDGKPVALRSLRGQKVVLYFYPRDDTPGCTREACAFRDNLARVRAKGAIVIGVSRDDAAAHTRFRTKYALPFTLVSDASRAVHRAYGAWGRKVSYGKETEGVIRSTFLLDEQGRVLQVWSPVKVDGHVDEVLSAL
jgi:peroxiredoxin Q/BCP